MSDSPQKDGWWEASDGKWYPPQDHADYVDSRPPPPVKSPDDQPEDQVEQEQTDQVQESGASAVSPALRPLLVAALVAIVKLDADRNLDAATFAGDNGTALGHFDWAFRYAWSDYEGTERTVPGLQHA